MGKAEDERDCIRQPSFLSPYRFHPQHHSCVQDVAITEDHLHPLSFLCSPFPSNNKKSFFFFPKFCCKHIISLHNLTKSLEDTYFKQLTPDPNFCG